MNAAAKDMAIDEEESKAGGEGIENAESAP